MERPTCKTCPFWDKKSGSPHGNCARHAPHASFVSNTEEDQYNAYPCWPKTLVHEWCGEHPDFLAYLASLKAPEPDHSIPDRLRALVAGHGRYIDDEGTVVRHQHLIALANELDGIHEPVLSSLEEA